MLVTRVPRALPEMYILPATSIADSGSRFSLSPGARANIPPPGTTAALQAFPDYLAASVGLSLYAAEQSGYERRTLASQHILPFTGSRDAEKGRPRTALRNGRE